MRVVFLDFDGVLHPAGEPFGTTLPFEWTDVLAALLAPFDDVQVVIHSSWRERFSAQELREFLGPVAARLLGAVNSGHKATAIERFLRDHPQVTDALVLDDEAAEYLPGYPVTHLICERRTGLSSKETQVRIEQWLLGDEG